MKKPTEPRYNLREKITIRIFGTCARENDYLRACRAYRAWERENAHTAAQSRAAALAERTTPAAPVKSLYFRAPLDVRGIKNILEVY